MRVATCTFPIFCQIEIKKQEIVALTQQVARLSWVSKGHTMVSSLVSRYLDLGSWRRRKWMKVWRSFLSFLPLCSWPTLVPFVPWQRWKRIRRTLRGFHVKLRWWLDSGWCEEMWITVFTVFTDVVEVKIEVAARAQACRYVLKKIYIYIYTRLFVCPSYSHGSSKKLLFTKTRTKFEGIRN